MSCLLSGWMDGGVQATCKTVGEEKQLACQDEPRQKNRRPKPAAFQLEEAEDRSSSEGNGADPRKGDPSDTGEPRNPPSELTIRWKSYRTDYGTVFSATACAIFSTTSSIGRSEVSTRV